MPDGLNQTRYLPAFVIVASLVLGVAVAVGGTSVGVIIALLLATPLLVAQRRVRVVFTAVLLIALVNGIPFVDLAALNLSGSFNYTDPILLVLFGIGMYELVQRPGALRGLVPRWMIVMLLVFTVAWVIGVATGASQGTPVFKAILFGRDLLTIWLIVVVALVFRDSTEVRILLCTLIVASVIYSGAHAIQVGLGIDTSSITHPKRITDALGFARLYSSMNLPSVLGFLAATGFALWARSGRMRAWSAAAASVIGLEQILQLTRANYLALSVALVVGCIAAFATGSVKWGVGRTGNALVGVSALVVGGYALSFSSLSRSSIWVSVQSRIASAASDVSAAGGNVGYRLVVYAEMLRVLGNNWILGIGLQHPEYHWFAGLPDGTIRNSDVGILSVLLPIGLLGLVPLLLIGLLAGVGAVRAMRRPESVVRVVGWSCLGICVVGLVSAPTLGYFSTLPGLMAIACAVGLLCRVRSEGFVTDEMQGSPST
ncbi:MAG: hypothetical protein P4L93_12170 [Coriobacteriia bacterium]|nr:hypothetical protein [Coriobacteriia bacterium]